MNWKLEAYPAELLKTTFSVVDGLDPILSLGKAPS
jgi:hypothetical protein